MPVEQCRELIALWPVRASAVGDVTDGPWSRFVSCCYNVFIYWNDLFIPQLPDLVTQLGLLYHSIESRVKMFHKLTKLHGKLYLLISQVGSCSRRPVLHRIALGHFMLNCIIFKVIAVVVMLQPLKMVAFGEIG